MRITKLAIRNFRSIKSVDLGLGETTVLIGANNSGKSAILDALRLVLNWRWTESQIQFSQDDVHRLDPRADPRTLPPVQILVELLEDKDKPWNEDMTSALADIIDFTDDDRSIIKLQLTVPWDQEKELFQPRWQFLNKEGEPFRLSDIQNHLAVLNQYLPLFSIPALRDAVHQFKQRSGPWVRLLNTIRLSVDFEKEMLSEFQQLDERIFSADPRFSELIEIIKTTTKIAMKSGPGDARLSALPVNIEDVLQRVEIVLRNENSQPWLALSKHGQGLQSMAVIFLFQAVLLQKIRLDGRIGSRAIFSIEEPEVHLHPQAVRSLWDQFERLDAQKIVASHSPSLVQKASIHDIRVVRWDKNGTNISSAKSISSEDEKLIKTGIQRLGGELLFARHWILVEGVTDYLLLHAIAKGIDWPLDARGVAVVDFQTYASAGAFVSLAESLSIPWSMIVDGDQGGHDVIKQIRKRKLGKDRLESRIAMLPEGRNLEDELNDLSCIDKLPIPKPTQKNKTSYMVSLASLVESNAELARQMPTPFVDAIRRVKREIES